MRWDSSRTVPWKRLCIEWAIVAVAIAAVSVSSSRNRSWQSLSALILGGAVYIGLGAAMAKLGYSRKTLKQLRAETAAARATSATSGGAQSTPAAGRPKPPPEPTKRTGGDSAQRRSKRRR